MRLAATLSHPNGHCQTCEGLARAGAAQLRHDVSNGRTYRPVYRVYLDPPTEAQARGINTVLRHSATIYRIDLEV